MENNASVKKELDKDFVEVGNDQLCSEEECDSKSFENSILSLRNEKEDWDMGEGPNDPEKRNGGDEGEKRPAWSNKVQYILAQVGFAVGLGNVWRFPYMCQKNGGGAYLLPYVILLVLIGIPLFFLELAVGQRIRRGSIGVWNYISPRLGGIGIASCVVCFFVALYYNVIIGWSLWYFSQSFQQPLPWNECPLVENETTSYVVPECEKTSATTYYWYREVLEISDSISEGGGIKWQIMLCLLGAWLLVCLGMIKGIQSSGKVMYFSSVFPYLVLICFLIRAILLKGSVDGIVYLFTPKLEVMLEPTVWRDAATQVFFALGLGFGGIIAYSSYNKSKNNCQFDAFLVTFIDFFTSVLASLVVFAVLGFKANIMIDKCVKLNTIKIVGYLNNEVSADLIPESIDINHMSTEDYQQVTSIICEAVRENYPCLGLDSCDIKEELSKAVQGTGLTFIAFTEAMTHFPASQFWSVMFFLMLVNLGLGSMFGLIQAIITPLVDTFKVRKEYLTVGCCFIAFSIGLIFVQRSGNYFVAMFDDYSATVPLLIVATLENMAVSWVYGTDKFFMDLKDMLGFSPYRYFYYMWKYITPLLMIILLSASAYQLGKTPPTYSAWNQELVQEQSLSYPPWGLAICILLIIIAILPVPVVLAIRCFNCRVKKDSSMSTISYNKRRFFKATVYRTGEEERDDFQSQASSEAPAPMPLEMIYKQSISTAQTGSPTNGFSSTRNILVHVPEMPVSDL